MVILIIILKKSKPNDPIPPNDNSNYDSICETPEEKKSPINPPKSKNEK